MKTLTTRTNEKFTFQTIVFASKQDAESNSIGQEYAVKINTPIHGADGYAVKVACGDFKEQIRLPV